jgi:hypothetical protein
VSALRIEPLKKRAEYPFCLNACMGVNGVRAARFRVLMADYPAGVLCASCARDTRAIWDSASSFTDEEAAA